MKTVTLFDRFVKTVTNCTNQGQFRNVGTHDPYLRKLQVMLYIELFYGQQRENKGLIKISP